MLTYESEVVIARPAEVIFPYLIEQERQALWSDVPMRKLTEGPFAAGSRLEVTFGMGPLKARIGLELTAVEPGRRMAFGSFSGPIRWDGEYRLEPSGSGSTRVRQHGSLRFSGLWRILEAVIGGEIRRGEIKELERLKSVVENA